MADRIRSFVVALIVVPALFLAMSGLARAATLTVTNTNDTGAGSLRDEILAALPGDTINFSVSGTITLGSALPAIAINLTIDGSGQSITIDGANSFSIFNAQTGVTLNLEFLTLAHGSADEGGAIFNQGTTTVTNCTFSGNTAIAGGAIFTNGAMMITNSTFSSNQAAGGGAIELNNPSNVTITNSTFSDNQSGPHGPFEGPGGAIANDGGKLSVTNSMFFDNQAFGGEGASGLGGAIFNTLDTETIPFTPATLTVTNSTFSGNKAEVSSPTGGAIANFESTASLKGNILASSTPNNCNAAVTDAGYNISDDGSCGFTGTSIDNSTTLHLDPAGLRNNGGPTNTIALEPNSQAVDFIPVADCTDQSLPAVQLMTHQRGFPRPDPGNPNFCDVGAFELQTMPVVISSNGERVQIARSTTPDSDQVNMAFTFTEIGPRRATRRTIVQWLHGFSQAGQLWRVRRRC
jgi:predicted outer membrane repeat protein